MKGGFFRGRLFLMVALLVVALFAFGGCGGGGGGDGDNPSENVPFSALSGNWRVASGNGTATGAAGRFNLSLDTSAANEAEMILISENGSSSAIFNARAYSGWIATNGSITEYIVLDYSAGGQITVERVNSNTFRYQMATSTLTLRAISETEGRITETGTAYVYGDPYQYSGTYTLVPQ